MNLSRHLVNTETYNKWKMNFSMIDISSCPKCSLPAPYSRRRQMFYCDECEFAFESDVSSPDAQQTKPKSILQPITSSSKGRIFLSYGHDKASTDLVIRLAQDLRGFGWTPWIILNKKFHITSMLGWCLTKLGIFDTLANFIFHIAFWRLDLTQIYPS